MDFCNKMWDKKEVLEELKKGLLIRILKNGDLSH